MLEYLYPSSLVPLEDIALHVRVSVSSLVPFEKIVLQFSPTGAEA